MRVLNERGARSLVVDGGTMELRGEWGEEYLSDGITTWSSVQRWRRANVIISEAA